MNSVSTKWVETCKFCIDNDITTITETKLNSSFSTSSLKIQGFTVNRRDRNRNGGGLLTYIKDIYSPTEVGTIQDKYSKLGLELTVSKILIKHPIFDCLIIIGLYRPPDMKKEWFDLLNGLLQESSLLGPLVLLGDLNANLMDTFSYPGSELLNSLSTSNISVPDIFPTRITDRTATCLDIIAIDNSFDCADYHLESTAASDHSPIVAKINVQCIKQLKPIVKRSYKNINPDELSRLFSAITTTVNTDNDVNYVLSDWYSQVNDILDQVAPFKNHPFKKHYLPWVASSTKKTMSERDNISRKLVKAKKSGSDVSALYNELKHLRKRVKGQIKHDLKTFGSEVLSSNNHRNIWNFIRNVSFTSANSQSSSMDPIILNDYFAKIVQDPDYQECVVPQLSDTFDSFNIQQLSVTEVAKLLRDTDSRSSSSHDGIPGHLLKRFANSLAVSICNIFNASITQSSFPDCWKKSNICAVWKSKGSKSDPSNYRPISIIPILGRLLEKAVSHQLTLHCEAFEFIPQEQFGFRKKSNCESALLSATDKWIEQIDSGKLVGALLIDISKAFDSVPHQLLLTDLAELHCSFNTICWFRSYLSDRQQRVIKQDLTTPWKDVTRGVPQGSCLSPLLFNIFVRDLPACSNSNTWQFADDVTQSEAGDTIDSVLTNLSNTFQLTKKFCADRHLLINDSKTQLIIFKSPAKKIPDTVQLHLDSCIVTAQAQVKLLGVTLDRHITFKDHITATVNTCNGLLGVLRRISHSLPRKLSKLFYTAMIRSHLEYVSNLLVPVAKVHLDKLEVVQRKAARIICQVPSDSHADPLLEELELQTLHSRRLNQLEKMVKSCLESKCHPDLVMKFCKSSHSTDTLTLPAARTFLGKKRFSYYGAKHYNDMLIA